MVFYSPKDGRSRNSCKIGTKNKDNLIQANISNYDLTMQLLGIEYDESGHYSSSRIKVKAKCAT